MHNKRETMSHHGNLANYPELRKSWVLEETPQTLICSTSIIPSNNLKAFVLIPIYLIPSSRKLPFVTNRDYYKKNYNQTNAELWSLFQVETSTTHSCI